MAVTTGEMRTTSRWAHSPTSASWINTSTSKRRLKVGSAVAGGSVWCIALVFLLLLFFFSARKESAKEKQLKEEEKILESVAEGRGMIVAWAGMMHVLSRSLASGKQGATLSHVSLPSLDVSEGDG